MKALFITTQTVDCVNHVKAWESAFGPVEHATFDHMGIRNDWLLADLATKARPEVIFYIGAYKAPGNPGPETFIKLRTIAPLVNLVSDAADKPWHDVLMGYHKRGCFDLQVSIDGAINAPGTGYTTLTPVDPRPFDTVQPVRDIRCGFSGSVGRWNSRSEIVRALEWLGGLTVRHRDGLGTYEDHARFMKRCRMLLNVSYTGSGNRHHVKGRVLEAGWAGCCLLESEGSLIGEWFPADCYLSYRDPPAAARLIAETDDATIERTAARLAAEVRTRFSPLTVYGEILSRVDRTLARPAA